MWLSRVPFFWQPRTAGTTSSLIFAGILSFVASGTMAAEQAPFVTLDKGFSSGIRERKFVVAKTEQEWQDLWRAHGAKVSPPKEPPSVDFEKEMVVAVFLGERHSGGYRIEIVRIEEDLQNRQLTVGWRETKPPPGAMTIQALTQPYQIVKLKTSEFPVAFVFDG
jgi:hypothetical protein